jgi:hypothetical protein
MNARNNLGDRANKKGRAKLVAMVGRVRLGDASVMVVRER